MGHIFTMRLEWVGMTLVASQKRTEPHRDGTWNVASIDQRGSGQWLQYEVWVWDYSAGGWIFATTCHTEQAAKVAAELLI